MKGSTVTPKANGTFREEGGALSVRPKERREALAAEQVPSFAERGTIAPESLSLAEIRMVCEAYLSLREPT